MITKFLRRQRRFAVNEYPVPFRSILNCYDDMESYRLDRDLNGAIGGSGWFTPYNDRYSAMGLGPTDSIESYTSGSSLNGLNGGVGYFLTWGGPYVDR